MDFDSTASYRLVYSVTRDPGLTKRASRNPFIPPAQLDRLPDAPRHAVARNMPATRAVGAPSAVCVLHDQGNDEPFSLSFVIPRAIWYAERPVKAAISFDDDIPKQPSL